ncbi:MAG: hypothetical protein ABI999_10800 [Acidobacteriota bacterium]
MNRSDIEAIIAQYEKHGWRLRRVIVTEKLRNVLGRDIDVFRQAEVVSSDVDAAWFSRVSGPGKETWELRGLASAPFALDAFLSDDLSDPERDEILQNTVERMRGSATSHGGH